ncbi:MAG: hypothetical protein ABWY03_05645 [Microbacterium sp.]
MTDRAPASATATLVAADAVDKPTALAIIARAVGSAVDTARPARPRIPLADGVWIEIDIPKFGEPPPLAIDVHATAGFEAAKQSALAVLPLLRAATEWTIVTDFDRVREA